MSTYAIISSAASSTASARASGCSSTASRTARARRSSPTVLLTGGGDAGPNLSPSATVTARVVADVKGEKIRIGKYRPKNGYKKHTGFRASLSQIEIESIGARRRSPRREEERAGREGRGRAPAEERVKGMPSGYEELTVAEIKEQSTDWNRPMLEAALEYEQAGAAAQGRDRRDRVRTGREGEES